MDGQEFSEIKNPETLAKDLIIGKNFWLTKIRWVYTFFILIFFHIYNYLSKKTYIENHILILLIVCSIFINVFFMIVIKKEIRKKNKGRLETFSYWASLQLDFDFVILSSLIFFSGGFYSPIIVLFIFHIMVSTFLILHRKAFRNTLITIILVTVLFFKDEGLMASPQKLTTMIAFNIILIFSFFVSTYLSRNLSENEKILAKLLDKTRELSITDGLTSLYNQTYFFKMLNWEFRKAKRHNFIFSIIIFDVDFFKNYNDNNGHILGSEALKKIASLMKNIFRTTDILAKYGGDEYVILLSQTDKIGAFLAADRLREIIESELFSGEEKQPNGRVTISLGIASYPEHGATPEEILDKADQALYFAKETGRNRAIIYSEKSAMTK